MLDHQENSHPQARISLLNQFKEIFGVDKILSFSADREFVRKIKLLFFDFSDLLNYLKKSEGEC
ncbi:hypothetical protein HE1_01047 [Holospora elegans E1]|uniref:Uncharacterized protein n=1 Tax=Holospora elegans E1 TaxID=1427503 RepID=A0A023DZY1_9PROT|nr:hypothetical protein [Holospora elegans]GAJ46708.1 hypothetical protein HE1_01047 [Holospora elegans E1]